MIGVEIVGVFIRGNVFARAKPFTLQTPQHFSNPVILHTYLPMNMEHTGCSKTSAYKIQTPGNYPEESIQYSEHSESLKSRRLELPHL
jgi:hypothetical protein